MTFALLDRISPHLYDAQVKLSETGRKHGVTIRFSHGKGGTIERKYANKENAAYNIELLVAGTTRRAVLSRIGATAPQITSERERHCQCNVDTGIKN